MNPAEFDHHSEEFARDPFGHFDALREHGALARSERYGGFWAVLAYDAVAEATRDGITFSSENRVDNVGRAVAGHEHLGGLQIPPAERRTGFIESDGPMHMHFRRLLNPWLSPAAVDRWRRTIVELAVEVIEKARSAGQCDIVHDLASPVSARLVMDQLDLPRELGDRFADAMHRSIGSKQESEEQRQAQASQTEVMLELRDVIEERHEKSAGEDLISFFGRSSLPDGTRLSVDDVSEQIGLFLAGGLDTTASLITNSLIWLSDHPEQVARLRSEPELWPMATEEFLRFASPVLGLARTVVADTTLGGVALGNGDRLLLCFGAANRDPAEFDRPHEVVLDRFPNRHLTFGVGAHRCIGSNQARAVFQAVMPLILANCLEFQVDLDRAIRYPSVSVANGWLSVPMTFKPAAQLETPVPYSWR